MKKSAVQKVLRKIDREYDKWYDGSGWTAQQKFLSQRLVKYGLLKKNELVFFWRAFDKTCTLFEKCCDFRSTSNLTFLPPDWESGERVVFNYLLLSLNELCPFPDKKK